MLEFKYDTQLLIEGEKLDEDEISEYFTEHFKGDCLLAVGDDELIKIHFHGNPFTDRTNPLRMQHFPAAFFIKRIHD